MVLIIESSTAACTRSLVADCLARITLGVVLVGIFGGAIEVLAHPGVELWGAMAFTATLHLVAELVNALRRFLKGWY